MTSHWCIYRLNVCYILYSTSILKEIMPTRPASAPTWQRSPLRGDVIWRLSSQSDARCYFELLWSIACSHSLFIKLFRYVSPSIPSNSRLKECQTLSVYFVVHTQLSLSSVFTCFIGQHFVSYFPILHYYLLVELWGVHYTLDRWLRVELRGGAGIGTGDTSPTFQKWEVQWGTKKLEKNHTGKHSY